MAKPGFREALGWTTQKLLAVQVAGEYDDGTPYEPNGGVLTVFPSGAYAVADARASTAQTNINGHYLRIDIDVTSITATPSVVFAVQFKDELSGTWTSVLSSAAVVATGHTVLQVGPGMIAAANLIAQAIIPRTWRVVATHGDTDSITYSVSAFIS